MPDVGFPELLIILVIVVILFGPGRLAGLGSALGQSIREFRRGLQGEDEADESDLEPSETARATKAAKEKVG